MKKILILIVAFINIAFCTFAQESSLTFFAQNGEKFWVILDGEKKNQTPQANVQVKGLTGKYYKAKVIFENPQFPAIDDNVYAMEMDAETQKDYPADVVYVIRPQKVSSKKAKKEPVKYVLRATKVTRATKTNNTIDNNSKTDISTPTTPVETNQNMRVDNGNMQTMPVMKNEVNVNDQQMNTNMDMGGANMKMDANEKGFNFSMTTPTGGNMQTNTSTYNRNSTTESTTTVNTMPNSNSRSTTTTSSTPIKKEVTCITDTEFKELKSSIQKQNFFDTKLTVAKQGVKNRCVKTDQVKELTNLFSMDEDKLTFAKFAYEYTQDKESYFKLNDVFNFSDSVENLNEFIEGKNK